MESLLIKMHRMSSKAMSLINRAKTTAFRSMCAIYRNQRGQECPATAVRAVTWKSMCKTSQDLSVCLQLRPQQRHRHQNCLHLQAMSPLIFGRMTKLERKMKSTILRLWARKMVHSLSSRSDSATSTTWTKWSLLCRLHLAGTVLIHSRSMRWTRITIVGQAIS